MTRDTEWGDESLMLINHHAHIQPDRPDTHYLPCSKHRTALSPCIVCAEAVQNTFLYVIYCVVYIICWCTPFSWTVDVLYHSKSSLWIIHQLSCNRHSAAILRHSLHICCATFIIYPAHYRVLHRHCVVYIILRLICIFCCAVNI